MYVGLFEFFVFSTFTVRIISSQENSQICDSEECINTAEMFMKHMKPEVLPCDNMYNFMCGNFATHNPVQGSNQQSDSFRIRGQYVDKKLYEFLTNDNVHTNISAVQKARTMFRDCLDEDAIEKLGVTSILIELNSAGLPVQSPLNTDDIKPYNFGELLGKLHRQTTSGQSFFGLNIVPRKDDSTKYNFHMFNDNETVNWTRAAVAEGTNIPEAFARRSHITPEEENKENLQTRMKPFIRRAVDYMNKLTMTRISNKTNGLIEKGIQEVTNFFIKLDESSKVLEQAETGQPENYLENISITELQKKTDDILEQYTSTIKINWLDYLETIFKGIRNDIGEIFQREKLIVIHKLKFEVKMKIIAETNPRVLISAMWWLVIRSVLPVGTKEFKNLDDDINSSYNESFIKPSRETKCLGSIHNRFPYIMGLVLVSAENNALDDQNTVFEMLGNIKAAFEDTLSNSTWVDEGTKMANINKLQYIMQNISVRQWMLDPSQIESTYSNIEVHPGFYYITIRNIELTKRETFLSNMDLNSSIVLNWASLKNNPSHLQKNGINANIIPRNMGSLYPGTVNACYFFDNNGIDIPIGILGPPFFGLGLQALNYGAIGAILAHELGHAFDTKGKQYNTWGKQKEYWKKRSNSEYEDKTKCFIDAYNDIYIPEAQMKVNGTLTLNENIADYVGFTQALKAYRMYVKKHGEEKTLINFDEYSAEQLLTMSFAHAFCQTATADYMKKYIQTDVHAPGRARVLGVLKNVKDFADIWSCGAGTEMNPIKKKCDLW